MNQSACWNAQTGWFATAWNMRCVMLNVVMSCWTKLCHAELDSASLVQKRFRVEPGMTQGYAGLDYVTLGGSMSRRTDLCHVERIYVMLNESMSCWTWFSISRTKEIPKQVRDDGSGEPGMTRGYAGLDYVTLGGSMSRRTTLCHAERGCLQPNSASLVQRRSRIKFGMTVFFKFEMTLFLQFKMTMLYPTLDDKSYYRESR